MTTTEPRIAERSYGTAPPAWVDLDSLVPGGDITELHVAANAYFDQAETFVAKARAVWALLAKVEARERDALRGANLVEGQAEDGLGYFLSEVTGTSDVRRVMHTVAEALHPERLDDQHTAQAAKDAEVQG